MLRMVFWNLNRNRALLQPLAELVKARDVDLVIMAECPLNTIEMRLALSDLVGRPLQGHSNIANKRISILAAPTVDLQPAIEESRYIVVHPVRTSSKELLLAAMHGISLLENDPVDLNEEAIVAAQILRNAEEKQNHRRSIVLGDFNLNPFDPGMAKARGFYGVMSRDVADRETQRLKFNDYPLLYNPMWSRLGDDSVGPAGTFYRSPSSHLAYYWHTYDQVLMRPSLVAAYDSGELEVLTRIGEHALLRDGIPDEENYSDHLPVFLALDLAKI